MPALTETQWAALRAEWEHGTLSNRALGEKYGVSESAIRKRSLAANQPGGAWRRDDRAVEDVVDRATLRTLTAAGVPTEGARHGAQAVRSVALARTRAEVAGDAGTRSALREELIERASAMLAEENLQHLERLAQSKRIADRIGNLIEEALAPTPEEDEAAVKRAGEAMGKLLAGRNDSIAGHVQTHAKALDSIQIQMRRALGLDDKAKRVEVTGRNGGAIETETRHVLSFDPSRIPTDDLQRFLELADYVGEAREAAPLPMPPEAEAAEP